MTIAITSAGQSFGQASNSADITGTVTDQSGGVLPNVAVKVLDVDKNVTHSYVTNGAGVYDTGSIVPDHYLLTFTREGFSTYLRGPINLELGVTGINVQMAVGQSTERVVVTTAAPLLQTETSELSVTLPSETIAQLPQAVTGTAPDWQNFVVLQPGASGTPQNGNNSANPGMQVAANGSLPFSTALLDGASTSSPMSNNVLFTPIFDSIAEVKMTDSLFSAQYGVGGMLYQQISKGGSTRFHGMAYDYFQNNALNAGPYGFGQNTSVPLLRYNDYGFNIGGPLFIPHVTGLRAKRIFLFFDLERQVDHGGAANTFETIPTAAMMAGDFTGQNPIYDPTTQTVNPVTGVVTRRSFASEYGNGNKIPSTMIDPVAKALNSYFTQFVQSPVVKSVPNPAVVNGIPINNYFYNLPSSTPASKYFGRIDADITPTNRLTGSSTWNNQNPLSISPICPVNCVNVSLFSTNNQISDVWTINQNLVNEARLGFMGEYDELNPESLNQGIPAKLGLQFAHSDVFPTINISGIFQNSSGATSFAPGVSANYKENLFDPSDVVTMIRGRHVLHFGGEILIERADSTAWGNLNAATLGFTGAYTTNTNGNTTTTGSSYADFLLGEVNSWSSANTPEYGGRLKNPQFFVQDDFKLHPNLTLNLGLRWQGDTGWHEIHGNELSFDPTVLNPATNTLGAAWYGFSHANGRTSIQKPVWNSWMPRLGFAYAMGRSTTLRGGWGIYTFPWNTDTYGGPVIGGAFGATGSQNDSTNGASPVVILSSSGNTNYQGAKGASINSLYLSAPTGAASWNGQPLGYQEYNTPIPRIQQWNFTVQRQMTQNIVAQIAYIGSRGSELAFLTDVNAVPQSELGPNDSVNRPYVQFQSLAGVKAEGISNYNSLQLSVDKRMNSGLEFNANYTWSKFLDYQDSSGWGTKQGNQPFQNAYVPSANYGPSNFDIREMLKGQAVYEIPIGRGRQFINNSTLLDELIGGWRTSWTMVVQGGNPLTPLMAVNDSYSLAASGSQYPNVVGTPKLQNASPKEWFNTAAFANPGPGVFGDLRRNSVYGPGLVTFNANLSKTFSIWESAKFELSGNASNVFNHPAFSPPDDLIGPGHNATINGVAIGGRSMEIVGKLRF